MDNIYLWVAIGVLLVAIIAVGSIIVWKALKRLKNLLASLQVTAAQAAANHTALGQIQTQIMAAVQQVQAQMTAQQETLLSVLNQSGVKQVQAAVDSIRAGMTANQIAVAAAMNKNTAMSGKIRTEMTAYHAALMESVNSLKTENGRLPGEILDSVQPLNNNDGSTYGFKIPLTNGGMFVAVVHSSRKDDLLKDPEIAHYHYTLMLYNAKGELLDVRAAPVAEKQEK